jgi:hypothetical protein
MCKQKRGCGDNTGVTCKPVCKVKSLFVQDTSKSRLSMAKHLVSVAR